MVYGSHRLKTLAARLKWLRLSLAAFMLLATALEGMRICLCPLTSGTLAQQCHADDACCGSVGSGPSSVIERAPHDCGHLTFAALPPADRVTLGTGDLRSLLVAPQVPPSCGFHRDALPQLSFCRSDRHPPGAWPSYGLVVVRTEQILC
jgi:hypothetical protein